MANRRWAWALLLLAFVAGLEGCRIRKASPRPLSAAPGPTPTASSPPPEAVSGPMWQGPGATLLPFPMALESAEALPLQANPLVGAAPDAWPWDLSLRVAETQEKIARLRRWMEREKVGGVYLQQPRHFAWLTAGGENRLSEVSEEGVGGVLVTPEKVYLLAPDSASASLLGGPTAGLGWIPKVYPWQRDLTGEAPHRAWYLRQLVGSLPLASDVPLPGLVTLEADRALEDALFPLTPWEVERSRWLGAKVGEALVQVCSQLKPKMTEREVAQRLAQALGERGLRPLLLLVAGEGGSGGGIPSEAPLGRRGWVKVAATWGGLAAVAARTFCFGSPEEEWLHRYRKAVLVEADLLAHTRPGRRLGDFPEVAARRYRVLGLPEEGASLPQGGLMGFGEREAKVLPQSPKPLPPQALVHWHPTVAGVGVEDTWLVWPDRLEMLTATPSWPSVEVQVGSQTYLLPDVAVLPEQGG